MLPEGTLAELIDGIIYMSPSPLYKHQQIVSRLLVQIGHFVDKNDLGEVFTAPFDVYLDESANAVQPEILFIQKKNLSIIKEHVHGVPDLIIEVLSGGNPMFDTVQKKNLYERFAVKEYWIIDPETRIAAGYKHTGTGFEELGNYQGEVLSVLLNRKFTF